MIAESNRVALVTGGAKRVGRAIVEKLLASGFDVCFTYLASVDEADDLATAAHRAGRLAVKLRADLTDPDHAVPHVAHEFARRFDRLDLLVNNASFFPLAKLEHTTPAMLRKLHGIHVESPLLITQKLATMLKNSRGHIVNMLDISVDRPFPSYIAYCASKAALANITLSLARELAPDVTVNGIAPGVVEWPHGTSDEEKEKYLDRVPLKRSGTPEDVANLVHYLATDGSYITGQILRLDGGRSIT